MLRQLKLILSCPNWLLLLGYQWIMQLSIVMDKRASHQDVPLLNVGRLLLLLRELVE